MQPVLRAGCVARPSTRNTLRPSACPRIVGRARHATPVRCLAKDQQQRVKEQETVPNATADTRRGDTAGSDSEDSDDELPFADNPGAFTTAVNTTEGLFTMMLATGLGYLFAVDPWKQYSWDWEDAWLGLQSSAPVLGLVALLTLIPTSIGKPDKEQLELMSRAEDDTVTGSTVTVDLSFLTPSMVAAQEQREAAHQDDPPVQATSRPLAAGLQLFQWYFSKPWFMQFPVASRVFISTSSGIQLAGNELLARGLIVTLIAGWARDAVANADSTSVLFWGKLFRLSNEENFRWFGTTIVALASLLLVGREVNRVQQWSRLVLHRLRVGEPQQGRLSPSGSDDDLWRAAAGTSSEAGTSASGSERSSASSAASPTPGVGVGGIAPASSLSQGVDARGSAGSGVSSGSGVSTSSTDSERGARKLPPPPIPGLGLTATDLGYQAPCITLSEEDNGQLKVDILSVDEDDLRRTQEDGYAGTFMAVIAVAHIIQLAWLYGTTGNLLAPLVARMALDMFASALQQAGAQRPATQLAK